MVPARDNIKRPSLVNLPIKKIIIIRGLKFCRFSLFKKVCISWDLRWRRWARVAGCWLPPFPKCYTLDYQNPVFSTILVLSIFVCLFVCLAKVRISRRVFQENKAHQIFRKTNISYPVCVSGGKKWSLFGKFVFLPYYRQVVFIIRIKTLARNVLF